MTLSACRTRITGDHIARLASNNHLAWLTSNGFARLASHRLARVTAIPDYGKPTKNACFGTCRSRKNNNRGQHGHYNFVFHFYSPKNYGWGNLLATIAIPSLRVGIGQKLPGLHSVIKKSGHYFYADCLGIKFRTSTANCEPYRLIPSPLPERTG